MTSLSDENKSDLVRSTSITRCERPDLPGPAVRAIYLHSVETTSGIASMCTRNCPGPLDEAPTLVTRGP